MTNIEQLQQVQQQRLVPGLALLNDAKKNLEDAIALMEAREREYGELSADVQRNLDAIHLVARMAKELDGRGEDRSRPAAPPIAPEKTGGSPAPRFIEKMSVASAGPQDLATAGFSRSMRPLFSFNRLSTASRLANAK